ncbi:hypothetical protein A3715_22590 [Oleiphilus sp. HI0009]|nr:hypothetical protein A3715_03205 [Oleiphilus sp. HI0009]KZX75723.1 hypothetical protein A3715_22590 [Oleiphilus sp. HI0009]KZY65739.1 hypothetical protein A3738_08045 [Oleiphilus sp. HI0066]KZY76039.1 hypothetical protein A3739_14160 [Oleiphilus sp. HI0067]
MLFSFFVRECSRYKPDIQEIKVWLFTNHEIEVKFDPTMKMNLKQTRPQNNRMTYPASSAAWHFSFYFGYHQAMVVPS